MNSEFTLQIVHLLKFIYRSLFRVTHNKQSFSLLKWNFVLKSLQFISRVNDCDTVAVCYSFPLRETRELYLGFRKFEEPYLYLD